MTTTRTRLKNAEDLEQLSQRAVAEQDRTTHGVRVCLGTGCTAKGAAKVFERFRRAAGAEGQESMVVGGKCTGCHGFCERGPLVVVDPGNVFYQEVEEEEAPVEQPAVAVTPLEEREPSAPPAEKTVPEPPPAIPEEPAAAAEPAAPPVTSSAVATLGYFQATTTKLSL